MHIRYRTATRAGIIPAINHAPLQKNLEIERLSATIETERCWTAGIEHGCFKANKCMSNVIYKEVRGRAGIAWQQKAEEHAANGISFVVRPFSKQLHWPFLEQLQERFALVVTFNALQKAAYFDPQPASQGRD